MDEVGLGRRLQEARKSAGLTQQDLCHKAGLSYSTLAKIERGAIKSPSIFTIQSIASALNLSLDALIGNPKVNLEKVKRYRSKSGVRFVYFDINGCLVRFFHRAFTRVAAEKGVLADLIETTFWHYNDAICRGEMTITEFNNHISKELKITGIDWQKYYMDAVDPIQEMHELVTWASKYYQVGLLSNIMPGFIDEMLKNGLLPKVDFDVIIDSSVVGAIKPEPKIYKIAEEKSGVLPSEILFVDDSRSNIMAAQKCGWHVMWFDDYNPTESVARLKSSLETDTEV